MFGRRLNDVSLDLEIENLNIILKLFLIKMYDLYVFDLYQY